jgi:hypothetical protein
MMSTGGVHDSLENVGTNRTCSPKSLEVAGAVGVAGIAESSFFFLNQGRGNFMAYMNSKVNLDIKVLQIAYHFNSCFPQIEVV